MADHNFSDITSLTVQLLSAYVSRNDVPRDSLADLIKSTRAALEQGPDDTPAEAETSSFEPAVSVRKSLASDDHIISLIDGKPYKTLKRHLTSHGLTPDQYRERYNLPKTYPTVAKSYSEARRIVASKLGLGRKAAAAAPETAPVQTVTTAPVQTDPAKAKPARKPSKATSASEAATPAAKNNDSKSAAPAKAAAKKTATKKIASPASDADKAVAAQAAVAKPAVVEKPKTQTIEPDAKSVAQEKKSPRGKASAKGSETIADHPIGTAQAEKPIAPKTKTMTTKASNRKKLSIATSTPQAKDKGAKAAPVKKTAKPVNLSETSDPVGSELNNGYEPAAETTAT